MSHADHRLEASAHLELPEYVSDVIADPRVRQPRRLVDCWLYIQ